MTASLSMSRAPRTDCSASMDCGGRRSRDTATPGRVQGRLNGAAWCGPAERDLSTRCIPKADDAYRGLWTACGRSGRRGPSADVGVQRLDEPAPTPMLVGEGVAGRGGEDTEQGPRPGRGRVGCRLLADGLDGHDRDGRLGDADAPRPAVEPVGADVDFEWADAHHRHIGHGSFPGASV